LINLPTTSFAGYSSVEGSVSASRTMLVWELPLLQKHLPEVRWDNTRNSIGEHQISYMHECGLAMNTRGTLLIGEPCGLCYLL
jgi:hypothetical protein